MWGEIAMAGASVLGGLLGGGGRTKVENVTPPRNFDLPLEDELVGVSEKMIGAGAPFAGAGAGYRLLPDHPMGQVYVPGPNATLFGMNPFGLQDANTGYFGGAFNQAPGMGGPGMFGGFGQSFLPQGPGLNFVGPGADAGRAAGRGQAPQGAMAGAQQGGPPVNAFPGYGNGSPGDGYSGKPPSNSQEEQQQQQGGMTPEQVMAFVNQIIQQLFPQQQQQSRQNMSPMGQFLQVANMGGRGGRASSINQPAGTF